MNKFKKNKFLVLLIFVIAIAISILYLDVKNKEESKNDELQNQVYGGKEFVVEYKQFNNLYVFENPLNLDPSHWYDEHQYYPVDYGYGDDIEDGSPVNKVEIDDFTFQFGEVLSYPTNWYIVLTNYEKKMYMSVYDNTPSTEDLRGMLEQILLVSK